jgi:fumarate reductase flavoprotein subunit
MKEMYCDAAVVACGAGGLAACAQASELGLKGIGIEKGKKTGGAANAGMGLLGLDTDVQKRDLNSVTLEHAFRMFMDYTHWRVDANLVRNYFGKSADTIRWLEDMGVEFYKAARYFPGSEATWHIVMPENRKPGPGCAGTMMKILTEHARDLGTEFLMETSAQHLLMEDGRVCGVRCLDKDGEEIVIHAGAVIIATGGFGGNKEEVLKRTGFTYDKDFFGFCLPNMQGDGIRMAREAGAAKTEESMELAVSTAGGLKESIRTAFHQPNLLVNYQGDRFFNEEFFENSTFAANACNLQQGRCGIMVIDDRIRDLYENHGVDVSSYVLNRMSAEGFSEDFEKALQKNPYIAKADTLEELAEKMGIDKENFLRTVETYNHYCDTHDEQFGKRQDYLRPIRTAPFYACKFFPGAYGTLGGIKINHRTEVLTEDYRVIPGLYAAGTDTCTIYGDSYMFKLPGNSMGYSVNTGRMAAEGAAEYIRTI